MQNFFKKIQYPKLLVLLICIFAAYILFRADFFKEFSQSLNSHGYVSIFLAGFLFAYGFTAPFAIGFFLSVGPQINIFIAAPLAGIGALLADLLILQFVRTSFQDEFDRIKLTWLLQKIRALFDHHLSDTFKKYALWAIAGFLIASPLPDELGVLFVSGFTNLDKRLFSVISYILNTIGILAILAFA